MGPCTKAAVLCWIGNTLSGAVVVGGTALAVLDVHYRGIGAGVAILGVLLHWYFKRKANEADLQFKTKNHDELVRHNREIEKLASSK